MTSRWNEPLSVLPTPTVSDLVRRSKSRSAAARAVQLGLVPSPVQHVVRPFYREPGMIVRWWLCSCGRSIVRVRPRPYPPRHA